MKCTAVILGGLVLCAMTSPALAGPLEELQQVARDPAGGTKLVLRYIHGGEGLVYSDDGAQFSALCASALVPAGELAPPPRLGPIALSDDGSLFMGTILGLLRDVGADGCGWALEPSLSGVWVTDVVNHPADPSVLFAVTATASDGMNGIYRRVGSGPFEPLGTRDDGNIRRLHVVTLPSGTLRFYEGIQRQSDITEAGVPAPLRVRTSDDDGLTWQEHMLEPMDGTVELEAVDPTDLDRIVLSVRRVRPDDGGGDPKPQDSVLVSRDRGATVTEYMRLTTFGGIAFAPDGRLWIGDRGDSFRPDDPSGLHFAQSLDDPPVQVNAEIEVRCVHHLGSDDDRLFLCQPYEAGSIASDGTDYVKRFSYGEVEQFVACDAPDPVVACRQQVLTGWCGASHFPEAPMCCPYPDRISLDPNLMPGERPTFENSCPDTVEPPIDAGADAGPDAEPTTPPADDPDGCGCAVPGARGRAAHSSGGLLLLLLLALVRLRRPRREPRRA